MTSTTLIREPEPCCATIRLASQSPGSAENLARFRWHTGAEPLPVAAETAPALLFRDIGPVAMQQFLRSGLRRLAGPMTPITYLRTADYQEPYHDYGAIGRLVVLQPMSLSPWHSGLPHIYIAAAARMPNADALAFVPGGIDLHEATRRLEGVRTANEAREAFAGKDSDSGRAAHLAHLECLTAECASTERFARPLRVALQMGNATDCEHLRDCLARHDVNESDLCTAWHHLEQQRREWLKEVLPRMLEEARPWICCEQ